MEMLSETGVALRDDLAQRYGVSADAVATLMQAVARGGGTQAQFSHPEFGGMGQWSAGGMTMVGDMFNTGLQGLVAGLCAEIAGAMGHGAGHGALFRPQAASFQMSGGGTQWWPDGLGHPASSGAQNDMRYAIFPDTRRLAVQVGGAVTVYDTGEHRISGVSQQQSGDASWTFTSQFGTVPVAQLPVVGGAGASPGTGAGMSPGTGAGMSPGTGATVSFESGASAPSPGVAPTSPAAEPATADPARTEASAPTAPPADRAAQGAAWDPDAVLSALERLGSLRDKGIVSEAEFTAKKAELLVRL